jgi:serine/threonine protein phosphatase 1
MRVGEAQTPEGMRLYAIGDIHGSDDKLAEVHEKIAADLAGSRPDDHRIIHIGDYGDRGPDTAGVIARLIALTASDARVICLRGNHDQLLLDFLADPGEWGAMFLGNGGKQTLRSYGVSNRGLNYTALAEHALAAIPPEHCAFLDHLATSVRFGDYFFCHAGILPGVPLDAQSPDDLLWIREAFLHDTREHDAVIVHGHTVTATQTPEVHPNRIAIDTGAVFHGPLTCLVLEGTEVRFL